MNDTELTPEMAEKILKLAFATDEQMKEWEALPTREARKAYWDTLPTPQLKRKGN
jgi:hypothetical protein